MRIVRHDDPTAFLNRARAFLARAEAENNLLATIPAAAKANEANYFTTIEEKGDVIACAIRTPPNKAVISRAPSHAVPWMVDDLADAFNALPAVLGPEPTVAEFAELWSQRTGVPARGGMRQRLLEAREVVPVATRPSGSFRLAQESDLAVLTPWIASFIQEVRLEHVHDMADMARQRISSQSMYVWDDGGPVSMAAWAGRTEHGVRVNYVYTPPASRGRGYASACVAELTKRLLADGAKFCCLVTDLGNSTSNGIYEKLGYRPICDMSDFILVPGHQSIHPTQP